MNSFAKILIFIGILLVGIGVALLIFGNIFWWFGRLPGDIRIERQNFRFYFPLTSSILISIILTLVINLILRIINKS